MENNQNQPVKQKKPFYKRWWFILIVVIIVFTAIGNMGKDKKTPDAPTQEAKVETEQSSTESPVETKTEPKEKEVETDSVNWVKSGMHKVGDDIPAGEYFIKSDGMTYYQVASDSSGKLESILTNDNITTFAFVTVEEGQYFEFSSAKAALSSEIEPIAERGPGMYRVGIDIPAGEYKIKPDGFGYMAVLSKTDGNISSIVSNDNFETEKYITVQDGQYLQLSSAEIVE